MNCWVEDRVLHVNYISKTLPIDLDDLGTLYEGYIENRIGVNLPMKVLKAVLPTTSSVIRRGIEARPSVTSCATPGTIWMPTIGKEYTRSGRIFLI
jgi:hypothetical protein